MAPLHDPGTYLRGLHLFFMFSVGATYFVTLVILLSVGVVLSWTIIGPPLLLAALYLTRWAGDAEAWAVRHLHGMELRRPPTTIERGSYRSQVWARLIDPTTWTGLVYLLMQFPVGMVAGLVVVVMSIVSVAFSVGPFFVGPDTPMDFGTTRGGTRWIIDEPREAWWLPLAGAAIFLLEVHLINLLSAMHAWWARLMLGSRAPHITPGAPLEPADPTPSGPDNGPERTTILPGDAASAERARRLVESDYRPAEAQPTIEANRSPPTSPQAAAQLDEASAVALASLTPREHEVLRLIARGYSNAEIAEAFVLSEGTVKTHVKRVLSKLEVRDRTQAAVWAYDHRVVQPTPTVPAAAASPEPLRLRSPR